MAWDRVNSIQLYAHFFRVLYQRPAPGSVITIDRPRFLGRQQLGSNQLRVLRERHAVDVERKTRLADVARTETIGWDMVFSGETMWIVRTFGRCQ